MENTDRIIGSCLEINSDIIRMKFEDVKYPKWIISIKETYYRHKLIKSVKKLEKANVPLNKENLLELFAYIFSNFPPYGTYKNIKQVMHVDKEDMNIWKAVIRYSEDIVYSIDIDVKDNTFTVAIIVRNPEKDTRNTVTVYLKELYSTKENIGDHIYDLNKLLISIIKDYILDVIESTKELERKQK